MRKGIKGLREIEELYKPRQVFNSNKFRETEAQYVYRTEIFQTTIISTAFKQFIVLAEER